MKTIQELQQESVRKLDEKFVSISGVAGEPREWMSLAHDRVQELKSFLSSSQQSAYDLGCEVTMERMRKLLT